MNDDVRPTAWIARHLGVSRTTVRRIEYVALSAVRAALDAPILPAPAWMARQYARTGARGPYRCRRCGGLGHQARTCHGRT